MAKRALITGVRGQDGAYLAKLLLDKGYSVIGTDRKRVDVMDWRLKYLGIEKDVEIIALDLLEHGNIFRTFEKYQPDEIYNLAAMSFVGASFEMPVLSSEINAVGVARILDAIRTMKLGTRFYQASSSEMFGNTSEVPQTETTAFSPRSPYGVSKLFGHFITKNFREAFDIYACSGILFNHESPLRGLEFVTKKVCRAVAEMKYGKRDKLFLGNTNVSRDWGFAGDYVEGMWLMLQQDQADDYIIATGEAHTLKYFVEEAFKIIGIEIIWEGTGLEEKGIDRKNNKVLIEVSPQFFRPAEIFQTLGSPAKAKEQLGWFPRTSISQLIELMVEYEIDQIK